MKLTPLEKLIILAWRSVEDKGYAFQARQHQRAVVGTRVGLFETRLRILDGSPDSEHLQLALKKDVDLRGRTTAELEAAQNLQDQVQVSVELDTEVLDNVIVRRGSGLDQADRRDPGHARPRRRRKG